MNNTLLNLLLVLMILLSSGCMKLQGRMGIDYNLSKAVYQATEELLNQPLQPLSLTDPILVSSFVNIDDLEESSTFGRTLSEYCSSYLVQHDYRAVEMKLRETVFFQKKEGTFFLSRDIHDLSERFNAQAIIVGTYSIGDNVCYLTLRLVRAVDSVILGAVDFSIPLGFETRSLLGFRRVSKY